MVEWARLESECTGNGTEGSNPSLSAILLQLDLFANFLGLINFISAIRCDLTVVSVTR